MVDELGEGKEIQTKPSSVERLGNIFDKLPIQEKGYPNIRSTTLSDGTRIIVQRIPKRKDPSDRTPDEISIYLVDVATLEEEQMRVRGIDFSPLQYFVDAHGGIKGYFPTRVSFFVDDIKVGVGTAEFKAGEDKHAGWHALDKESNAKVADKMLTWTEQMINQNKLLLSPLAARLG